VSPACGTEDTTGLPDSAADLGTASQMPAQQASENSDPQSICPHCSATLRGPMQFCTQCGHRLEVLPAEAQGSEEKAGLPFAGLTSSEILELLQARAPEPSGSELPEPAPTLPEWLDVPLLPGTESVSAPSAGSVIQSRPPASAVELPSLPSDLDPISISPDAFPPQPGPILDARRIGRLQELATQGPWGGDSPAPSSPERGMSSRLCDTPCLLLAECRPGTTTAVLIESVEGWPRLVASGGASTDGDLVTAIRRACAVISGCTGRRFFGEDGDLLIPRRATGQGVDRFVAVMDAAAASSGLSTLEDDGRHQGSLGGMHGADQVRAWSHVPVHSMPSCLATVIRHLGEIYGANVLGLDLGRSRSWLVVWYQEQLTVIAGSGLGGSTGAHLRLGERGPVKALMASLWRQWTRDNQSLLPGQSPMLDLVMVRGPALALGFTPLEISRMLVDVLQPTGTCTLLWDRDGLAASLGALAVDEPAVVTCLLDSHAFLRLGTLIAPWGQPPRKGIALRFTLAGPKGRTQQGCVATGQLSQIALPLGRSEMLTLHPASGLSLGAGRPGRGAQTRVPGGLVGLLLDGRGRPLPALL
jgi:hypothetical protein